MKSVNEQDLAPSEYKAYKTNEKKMFDSFDEIYELFDYPPFSVNEKGEINSELRNEAESELLEIMRNRDENDMTGGTYKPFRQYEEQFSKELTVARKLKIEGLSPRDAIIKYAEEKKIKLDDGLKYNYGI
jgi:hypothetical protein